MSNTNKEEVKIEQLVDKSNENPNWLNKNTKNGIKISEKMYFDDALKYLHNQLHSLDL